MYSYLKRKEVPTSSPDRLTFPLELGTFKYTMENYVKSFTRKRVTKANLEEIIEEVNTALKSESDNFKLFDYLAILLILIINGGILACILTLDVKMFVAFAIKLGYIVVANIATCVIWSCCFDGKIENMRNKIQFILDSKDEYFESKGMRWTVCTDTEFPYWIELHIQSQFEMKLAEEMAERDGAKRKQETSYSENKGILDSRATTTDVKPKKTRLGALLGRTGQKPLANFDVDEELAEHEESQVQPPQPKQDGEVNMHDKKFDRLYAPLEEDYEENYDDEEANQ